METLDFLSEVVLYLGGVLAIFEFLPPEARASIDESVNQKLTWRLLVTVLCLTFGLHVVVRLFAYLSPYFILIACLAIWLAGKVGAMAILKPDEASVGCLFAAIAFPLAIAIAVIFVIPALQMFIASLVILIVAGVFFVFRSDSEMVQVNFFLILVGFLCVAIPSGLGYWISPNVVSSVIHPYVWVSSWTDRHLGWFFSHVLFPRAESREFETAFTSTANSIRNALPNWILAIRPFKWFELGGGGYLLIFAVPVQGLVLVYIWYATKLAVLSFSVPLIRFSNWLKMKCRIEQRRIPIAGAFLILLASTVMIILKGIAFFQK